MPFHLIEALCLALCLAPLPLLPRAHDVNGRSREGRESLSGGNSSLQEPAECIDRNHQCPYWSGIGECKVNPRYMHVMCTASCRLCPGDARTRSAELYRSLERQYLHKRQEPPPPLQELRELSYDPRIFIYDDFLTDEECEFLKSYAEPHLKPARTINSTTGLRELAKIRTNSQMYVNDTDCREHPVISEVIRRCHTLARIPLGHGEAFQVGRYKEGEFYGPHFDSEPAQDVLRSATVLIFLGAPEEGGETIFPKRRVCGQENFQSCCEDLPGKVVKEGQGLFIVGRKRQALLFYSHDMDGRHNIFGIHGSCPVHAGVKWIAQQWFRSKPYHLSPSRDFEAMKPSEELIR